MYTSKEIESTIPVLDQSTLDHVTAGTDYMSRNTNDGFCFADLNKSFKIQRQTLRDIDKTFLQLDETTQQPSERSGFVLFLDVSAWQTATFIAVLFQQRHLCNVPTFLSLVWWMTLDRFITQHTRRPSGTVKTLQIAFLNFGRAFMKKESKRINSVTP